MLLSSCVPILKTVTIHTDGGCEGNPGPGGWAAVLSCGAHTRRLGGGEPATTNNRMELQAAIAALSALKGPCEVELFTDSEYLRNGITKWIAGWKKRGWISSQKQPVKNEDLWRALDAAAMPHRVRWHWVRGHTGHAGNEECDGLARAEIEKIRAQFTPVQLLELVARFNAERAPGKNQPVLL